MLARATVPGLLDSMNTIDCIPVMKALSDPIRLRIVHLMMTERLSVNEVAQRLKLPHCNASRHLRVLREAGLLESRNEGKERRHTLAFRLNKKNARGSDLLDFECCTFRLDKSCC